ncbi:MAG TPA: LysR family transcriptional regulator [Acidimicrobiales bacterium]|nr:LysR family transcriptional regulator [Acidimicrobiales bacterium]
MPTSLQLTTQQLEYLVAVDTHGTWAEAAAALGVTPSALSQGIAELERRLGIALFARDGRRRVPTRDHAEVLRYAESTLAATRDLARWLASRQAGTTGAVRLGMIDAAATHHFRDVLRRHRRHRPDVALRLAVGPSRSLLDSLARAELDVVVCVETEELREGITQQALLDDPLSVLAPTPSPSGTGRGSCAPRPAEWGPWVTFPAGSHTRELIADALERAGARFEVVAESHQPEVLREMVLLGVGWTVLPLAGLGPLEGLDVVRPDLVARRLVLARRAGAPPDAAVDELVAALLAGAAE